MAVGSPADGSQYLLDVALVAPAAAELGPACRDISIAMSITLQTLGAAAKPA